MRQSPPQPLDPFSWVSLSSTHLAELHRENRLLFSEESILPEQLFSPPRTLGRGVGALIGAVLTDAITCFKKYIREKNPRTRRLGQEAEEWFFRNDPAWPFSFLSICEALNLDPEYIRCRLQQWRTSPTCPGVKEARRLTRVGRRLKVSA